MKKFSLSLLAVILLMTLVFGSALAAVKGDMTVRATKAYSDPGMTKYIGTIPKYTSVLVRAYGSYADVYLNGVECYVKASDLTQGDYDYNYVGFAILKSGANVYQRPSAVSKNITSKKARPVIVYAINGSYALIRTDYHGVFGFVKTSSLSDFKAD